MSLSTSEPLVTLSTSSGLSPQALHDRHAARQRAVQGEHDVDRRPALRRLRRLSDLRRARQHDVPQPGDPICPSSCRETACRLKTRSLETSAEPKTLAHLQASGTEPIGQQASPEKPPPRNTGQKGALAKHRQRGDAPRHLADPLSSKPVMPRKRNVSEVLNLCKGKVSQALAQRKHLKPARLEATSAARIRDKAMHRQQKPLAALVVNKAAAADDLAAHAKTQYHRGRARHPKAEALREQRVNHHDNSQVDYQLALQQLTNAWNNSPFLRCICHPKESWACKNACESIALLTCSVHFVVAALKGVLVEISKASSDVRRMWTSSGKLHRSLRRLLRWTSLPDARVCRCLSLQVLGTSRRRGALRTHACPSRRASLSTRLRHRCIFAPCE